MNELTQTQNEAANIGNEAMSDASFMKRMKFAKIGETSGYLCDGQEIPLGTQMVAQCLAWTKQWIHFQDQKVVERKTYRVAKGEHAPERDELPDNDQSKWPIQNGKPSDPWVLQYLLPMENPETDEIFVFTASSFGGKRAVGDLCSDYARRVRKDPNSGQPIIRLLKTMMPTKSYGNVARPHFNITGWSDQGHEPVREVSQEVLSRADDDMNDEIPF